MRGLSQELVIALIFGTICLVRFLYKLLYRQLRRKAASMQAEHEAALPPAAVASTVPAAAPRPAAAPKATAPRRVAPRTLLRARRFSRAALLPDRRAVQDAIVIAAILQPCHANRACDDK